MKKEHHAFVVDFFNKNGETLIRRFIWNNAFLKIPTSRLTVRSYPSDSAGIYIYDTVCGSCLYGGIKTKELAEEILQYIKDTEILFI